jgi:hypothetical protein
MARGNPTRRLRVSLAAALATGLATAGLAVVASLGAAPAAHAQTVPSDDLRTYVLFAQEELAFKGGQGNHGPSIIDGGNIGVNAAGFIRGNDYRLNLCANAQVVMSDDTMVVGDTARLGDSSTPTLECDLFEAFVNTGAPNNETPRSGPPLTFQPPVIKSAPDFPDFACDPGNPVTVPAQGSLTMSPDTYGAVNWQNGTTITLTAGTYTMCRITTGQNVTVITEPGVVLQVAQDFLINDNMDFDGDDCTTIPRVYVAAEGVDANSNAVRFGQDSEIWGHFWVPDGRLNLGNQTTLHGTFWSQSMASDFNVDVEYCAPPDPQPPTGEITVTKQVTGDTEGAPPDAQFTIHYNCTIPGRGIEDALDGQFTIAAGETLTFTGVQVGTTCTATEVETPDPLPGYVFDPPVITPDTVTVTEEGETVEVAVENPVREVFGALEVTKTVSGDTGGVAPDSVFGFALDCTDDAFDDTFELAAGETFTSDPIRVAVTCTVTETEVPDPLPGFVHGDPVFSPDPPTVTIGAENQTVTLSVDNPVVEEVGRLQVTKRVTGDVEGYVPDSVFGFALDCSDDAFDDTFELAAGDSLTTDDITLGVTCTVAETDVPDPLPGFAYDDAVYTPDPPTVSVTTAGQVVTVTAENRLVGPPVGPFEPTSPPPEPPAAPFVPAGPAAPTIPETGAQVGPPLLLGTALLTAGVLLLAGSRRWRRRDQA